MRIRLLPVIILISFALVVVKVSDVILYHGQSGADGDSFMVSEVSAVAEEKTIEEEQINNDKEIEYSPGAQKPESIKPSDISNMEKDILANLAKRREELQEWNRSISMKENILNATEKKINRKMDELKELQKEVSELLSEYNKKENKKIMRLVKIYENMKAADAARIFEDMEIPILLEVVDNMAEAKAAKILAKMDPAKAMNITTQLAKQRRLSSATNDKPL